MCTMVKRDVFDGKPMVYLCVRCCCALLGCVCKLQWGFIDNGNIRWIELLGEWVKFMALWMAVIG